MGPKTQNRDFIKNVSNNFDYISVIYRDHIFRKLMVCALGGPMQNINFLKIGFMGQMDFIAIFYSATNKVYHSTIELTSKVMYPR
jgi:hypothetical protein